jgi:hypothetical protein
MQIENEGPLKGVLGSERGVIIMGALPGDAPREDSITEDATCTDADS